MSAPVTTKQIKYKNIPSYKYRTLEDAFADCSFLDCILAKDYESEYLKLDTEKQLTIKAGYAWDGCSGPTIDEPWNMRAGLFHDALYQLMREDVVSPKCQKQVDIMFRRMLIEDALIVADGWREMIVLITRAWGYYRGVRFGGAKHTQARPEYDKVYTAP